MINDVDLHGYVGNQLDTASRSVVERYLPGNPDNPDVAQRIAVYRAQRVALRSAYDAPAIAHLISKGRLPRPQDGRLQFRRIQWEVAAAVVLAFGVAAAEG
jgi:anti-sigma factor RsiW